LLGHLKERQRGLRVGLEHHLGEVALLPSDALVPNRVDHKAVRVVELLGLPVRHHENPVRVDNRCESVRDDQDRAAAEPLPEFALNKVVGLEVDVCSGLVEHEDLGFADDRARQTYELLLACREEVVSFGAVGGDPQRKRVDFFLEVDFRYYIFDFLLSQFVEWIEVFANRALNQEWVLRDKSDLLPQQMKSCVLDIHAVNLDRAHFQVHKSEKRLQNRTLA